MEVIVTENFSKLMTDPLTTDLGNSENNKQINSEKIDTFGTFYSNCRTPETKGKS